MRLIDADALIPMMKYATTDSEIGVFPILIGFDAIKKVIDEQPTIEERPRGWWIEHRRTDLGPKLNNCVECSNCGIWFSSENLVRRAFCPNCGADMRTEQMLKLVRAWEKAHRKSAEGEE